MRRYILLTLLLACNNPVESEVKVYPPPIDIPSDINSPKASFVVECYSNRECIFDASTSHKSFEEYPIVYYGWSFGDGSVLVTTSRLATHTYDKVGIYTVMLTVWDRLDRGGRLYKQFEVK